MAKFISKKEEKYNADDIANQLISQINNNEVDSSKIKTEEILKKWKKAGVDRLVVNLLDPGVKR